VDESEVFIFSLSIAMAVIGLAVNRLNGLHALFFRRNPGPGIARLGLLLALGWILYVLLYHADPSVTGIYVVMYLVMGYAFVKLLGQTVPAAYGARLRVDVAERRNVPAALFIATFTLCTGLIFGGSLWGEADPVGDDEGGWWIPLVFFLLGWGCLLIAFGLFLLRERGRLRLRLQRERSMADIRPTAVFLLVAAGALTDAVAGDFWGWRHGLLTFGVLAGLLITHQVFAALTRPGRPGAGPAAGARVLETGAYALLGLVAWGLSRYLDRALGAG
jgi:hypothetical protein